LPRFGIKGFGFCFADRHVLASWRRHTVGFDTPRNSDFIIFCVIFQHDSISKIRLLKYHILHYFLKRELIYSIIFNKTFITLYLLVISDVRKNPLDGD
jgi:hypothetical protein